MFVQRPGLTFEKMLSVFGLALLLCVSIGVTAEVMFRKLFAMSFGGVDELSGYGFAIFTSFAFVLAIREKANIRIDLLRNSSPRPMRMVLDLVSALALLGFFMLLSTRAVLLALNSYEKGSKAITPLATPLYIPQSLWAAGIVLATTVLAVIICRAVICLFHDDTSGFFLRLAPSHEEDHADEYAVDDVRPLQQVEA